MKYTLPLLILIACSCRSNCPDQVIPDPVTVTDTIYVPVPVPNNSLQIQNLLATADSLDDINKKLAQKLLHSELKFQNAKHYTNIVIKNPNQLKFLQGWMRRLEK